jgi:energy-coupling factor transporter ATP-binding protein EcfA2
MCTVATGFPRELLTQPWTARLEYFKGYTVAHPELVQARDALLGAIHEVAPNSLILVLGPTGVGKTTLCTKIEQLLVSEMMPELETDPGRLPVVSVECAAPESGIFSWRDHFRTLLLQMEEPLVNSKINPEAPVRIGDRVMKFVPSARAVGSEYHRAVEQALRFRRPVAVLIDEAQHLARMGSGRRLADQLDVIKSIANRTRTIHVLLGTYELLAFRNLSGQLSRRSIDIHFPRYRADNAEGRKRFLTVLRSFEQQLPVPEPPDLVKDWEFLYERSLGCVGVLKDWLMRALTGAFRRRSPILTYSDFERHALSVAQCDKMLSEISEGEGRLLESVEERSRLRTRMGLNPHASTGVSSSVSDGSPATVKVTPHRKRRRKPGERQAGRDPIGLPSSSYATAASF